MSTECWSLGTTSSGLCVCIGDFMLEIAATGFQKFPVAMLEHDECCVAVFQYFYFSSLESHFLSNNSFSDQ